MPPYENKSKSLRLSKYGTIHYPHHPKERIEINNTSVYLKPLNALDYKISNFNSQSLSKKTASKKIQKKKNRKCNQGRILRRLRGLSRVAYIFSISLSGRVDPSGMLANFQPPPPPRFPLGPIFSTVKVHPAEGRRRLFLWTFTSPAICTQPN